MSKNTVFLLTSLKESHFNAGFHWNPLDGKSPHSFNDFFLRVYGSHVGYSLYSAF